jgi:hypothetical protein
MTIIAIPRRARVWRQSGSTLFDASGDFLNRTTGLLDANDVYTWSAWWQLVSDLNAQGNMFILSNAAGTVQERMQVGANGTLLSSFGSGTVTGSDLTIGVWYYLTMLRESDTSQKIYINRALDITNTNDVSARAALDGFQRINHTSTRVHARVANPMEWTVALTQNEIGRQMHSLRPIVRLDKLHAWHPGFPRSVDRTKDFSGNGRNWTENGTLTTERGQLLWVPVQRKRFFIIGAAPITLDAGKGDLTLTPRAAIFQIKLAANSAALTATPRTATLDTALATAPAQVTTTGETAALNTTLAANKGSLSLAGGTAELKIVLAAGEGALSADARTAALNTALAAGRGQLTATGRDAALNLGGNITLAASVGTLSLAGQPATFALKQISSAAALVLAGQLGTFKLNLSASEGGILVTPRGVTFATNLLVGPGALPLVGRAAVFQHLFAVGNGAILLTGRTADLVILSAGTPAVITAYDRALTAVTSSEQDL